MNHIAGARRNPRFHSESKRSSEWEAFEANFGLVFSFLVGSTDDDTEPAMRAYGSVLTFRGRHDMIKAAASAYFLKNPHSLSEAFDQLALRGHGFSARRNEIAHGTVQPYFAGIPEGAEMGVILKNVGWALGPSRFATNKRKLYSREEVDSYGLYPLYAYASEELRGFAKQFKILSSEAQQLWLSLLETSP